MNEPNVLPWFNRSRYTCGETITAVWNKNNDFGLIKLDRKVKGRSPLKVRTTGKIKDDTSLVVIGNPDGLPTKISAGGTVLVNTDKNRFETSLDTFHGNSGSAVLDLKTGMVEGILVNGNSDYKLSANTREFCAEVNRCPMRGCSDDVQTGEGVTRITEVKALMEILGSEESK